MKVRKVGQCVIVQQQFSNCRLYVLQRYMQNLSKTVSHQKVHKEPIKNNEIQVTIHTEDEPRKTFP